MGTVCNRNETALCESCKNGRVDAVQRLVDAGADGGTTYESPDDPTSGPVTSIAGAPFTGPNGFIQRLGNVVIERIDQED